jgi:hypothetical protein
MKFLLLNLQWVYKMTEGQRQYSVNQCGIGEHKSRPPGRSGDYIWYGYANYLWILIVELEFWGGFNIFGKFVRPWHSGYLYYIKLCTEVDG